MVPFATNEVVRLKSGGPNMIVVACNDDGVVCIWASHPESDPTPRVTTDRFPAEALVAVLAASTGGE